MAGRVPRLFPNSTIVCLASGPSLTRGDVDYCRGKAPVIAVNNTHEWAPWADVLYACDEKWWEVNRGVPEFRGLKFGLQHPAACYGVTILRQCGQEGLSLDPSEVATGLNSGHQAVNVAVHLGASRILLLGYDMQAREGGPSHFFGEHKSPLNKGLSFDVFKACFATMVEPLKRLGVQVINCSRETALTCFPRAALRDVL